VKRESLARNRQRAIDRHPLEACGSAVDELWASISKNTWLLLRIFGEVFEIFSEFPRIFSEDSGKSSEDSRIFGEDL
jgi:hypothetical protein